MKNKAERKMSIHYLGNKLLEFRENVINRILLLRVNSSLFTTNNQNLKMNKIFQKFLLSRIKRKYITTFESNYYWIDLSKSYKYVELFDSNLQRTIYFGVL